MTNVTQLAVRRMAPANAIQTQDHIFQTWCTIAPLDHSLEDVLHPSFLFAKHRAIRPHDRFDILHEGHDFLVRGIIVGIDVEAEAVQYRALEVFKLSEMPVVGPDWEGAKVAEEQSHGWAVRLDGRVAKRFYSEASAAEWLAAKQQLARAGVAPRKPESNR
jgi:hypothetical protein